MAFFPTTQAGPGADALRLNWPGIIQVGASCVLNLGTPVRRVVTAVQGQGAGYAWSATVPGIVGGDQAVVMNSTGGGALLGVYSGPTTYNNTSGAVGTSVVTGLITRSGVAPVLVGTASGGTAVKIGDTVGMSSLISGGLGVLGGNIAAPTGFAQVLAAPASQGILGTVLGYQVVTNMASAVNAGSSQAFNPLSIQGWGIGVTGPTLTVNPGGPNAETIAPSSVAPGTCAYVSATFGNASTGSIVATSLYIGNASTGAVPGVPGGIITVTISPTTAWTGTSIAAAYATALNTAFSALGVAPTNVTGVGGIQPFGIAVAATSILHITAAIPTPVYNTIAVSIPTAWVSSIVSPASATATSLGATSAGAYPVCYATFANNHAANEPLVGTVTAFGTTLCPVPQPGGANIALALVDIIGTGS